MTQYDEGHLLPLPPPSHRLGLGFPPESIPWAFQAGRILSVPTTIPCWCCGLRSPRGTELWPGWGADLLCCPQLPWHLVLGSRPRAWFCVQLAPSPVAPISAGDRAGPRPVSLPCSGSRPESANQRRLLPALSERVGQTLEDRDRPAVRHRGKQATRAARSVDGTRRRVWQRPAGALGSARGCSPASPGACQHT